MKFKLGRFECREDELVNAENSLVPHFNIFWHLCASIMHNTWFDLDMTKQTGESKWFFFRSLSITSIEGVLYRMRVRHAMLYGAECWQGRNTKKQKFILQSIAC